MRGEEQKKTDSFSSHDTVLPPDRKLFGILARSPVRLPFHFALSSRFILISSFVEQMGPRRPSRTRAE